MSAPVPSALARKGLMRISDNLQPGDEIDFNFFALHVFRSELEARFITPAKPRAKSGDDEKNKLG